MRYAILLLLATMTWVSSRSVYATDITYNFNGPGSIADWTFGNDVVDLGEDYRLAEINWNANLSGLGFDVPSPPPPPPNQYYNTRALSPPFRIPNPSLFFIQLNVTYYAFEPLLDQIVVSIYKVNNSVVTRDLLFFNADSEEAPGPKTVCEEASCADSFIDEGPGAVYQLWLTASDFDTQPNSTAWVRFDDIVLHNVESAQISLSGDYNGDGRVDAGDFVVWRKTNINGQQGYNTWRANFGASLGQGASRPGQAVPEANSVLLAGAVVVISMMTRSWALMRRRVSGAPA